MIAVQGKATTRPIWPKTWIIVIQWVFDSEKILIHLIRTTDVIHVAQVDRIMRPELRHQFSDKGGLVRARGPVSGKSNSYLLAVALERVDALIWVRPRIGQKGMARSDAKRKILPNPFDHSLG